MRKGFDVAKQTEQVIQWIKNFFENQPSAKGAVIGISGGKDSTVVGKLLAMALGANRVVGVLMPNGEQSDIDDSKKVCDILGIPSIEVNINQAYKGIVESVSSTFLTQESLVNIAPRLRMTTLYAIGQSLGCRVVGTGNKSEAYIGYCTKWGDTACDLNPLADFTKDEVVQIGLYLGLPKDLICKIPNDGLSGMSDEEKLGYTYEQVEEIIFNGKLSGDKLDFSKQEEAIKKAHEYSRHKFDPIPTYKQH